MGSILGGGCRRNEGGIILLLHSAGVLKQEFFLHQSYSFGVLLLLLFLIVSGLQL